ncbi:MAG: HAD family phosphatase [Clostridiales bacterium]|nr:HAD family phosphatase [Candidatus Equinaster intestinalis]
MIKLIAFDLDATLAPSHKPTAQNDVKTVTELEKSGVKIAICSGKTTYYLCGFARQFGLKEPILIGENGMAVQFGVFLPPREYYSLPVSDQQKLYMQKIKEFIDGKFPDIWYQPNTYALTPFITKEEQFAVIDEFLAENPQFESCLTVYRHPNCYDILPKGVTKKSGLELICRKLGIKPLEVIAVGDGINDYSMFEFAGTSVGIKIADTQKVSANFDSLADALLFIKKKVNENNA